MSESETNQTFESTSRTQPQPYDRLRSDQRPLDLLCQALLPAELIAPEKKLPLFHHQVVVVVAIALLHIAVVPATKRFTPTYWHRTHMILSQQGHENSHTDTEHTLVYLLSATH